MLKAIVEVKDEDSNLSDRLSGKSGSKGNNSGQESYQFGERQREDIDIERERQPEPIQEE